MSSRALRAGKAFIEFALEDRGVQKGLRKIERRLSSVGTGLQSVGKAATLAGGSIATALAPAVLTFASFDDRMRVVKAVTGATKDEFSSLTEEAKRLGATTSFSASQVADAMAELGRAGFKPQQILDSTESVLALSRATDTELPRSAEIAGAALRGFGYETSEMGRVTDVLTAAANGTSQTLEDLFEAMKPVAPIAAEAGESIEDTAAAIGILANNGIKGSLAGNALARGYKNLANTKVQNQLKAIGVEATDADDNLRPLVDIIGDLSKATADYGEAPRLAIFEKVFGRGQAAALKLAKATGGEYQRLVAQIRDSGGQALKTAADMDAGVGGSFRRFMSAVEGASIAIGDALAPTLARLTERINEVVGVATEWISQNQDLVVGLAVAAAGLIAVGAVTFVVGTAFSIASAAVGAFSAIIGAVAAVLASPVLLIGAIVVALATLVDWLFLGGRGMEFLWGVVQNVFGSIATFIQRKVTDILGYLGEFVGGLLGLDADIEPKISVDDSAAAILPNQQSGLSELLQQQKVESEQRAAELNSSLEQVASSVASQAVAAREANDAAFAAAGEEIPLLNRIAVATEQSREILRRLNTNGEGGLNFA
ncbi:MAG: phage tail tape measure protein [Planctomycetota bacterium]